MLSVIVLVGLVAGAMTQTSGCGPVKVEMEGATSSSVGWEGVPSRAVDGNVNGVYDAGSCYHSADNKWNKVTANLKGAFLGVTYKVASVRVWNRMDTCCDDRIDGAKVWAGNHLCGTIDFDVNQVFYDFDCGGAETSTVSVSHSRQYLQVCEIEAFVAEEDIPDVPVYSNVALNRPASQSSEGWKGDAGRAVDGNTDQSYWGGSCTHTARTSGNWWTVELANEEYVHSVVVHNRQDCCADRIDNAQVWLKHEGDYQLCGTIVYDADGDGNDCGGVYTILCQEWGTDVKITNNWDYLTLCEVEVIALEEEPSEMMDM